MPYNTMMMNRGDPGHHQKPTWTTYGTSPWLQVNKNNRTPAWLAWEAAGGGGGVAGGTRSGSSQEASITVETVRDYVENTSLHGLKYTIEESFSIWERILWFLICCAAVAGAVVFLEPFFTKYLDVPLSTSIKSTAEPIWHLLFPAVTICNINKARTDSVIELYNTPPWNKYSNESMHKVIDLMSTVGMVKLKDGPDYDGEVRKIVDEEKENIDDLMRAVMQPITKMGRKCWWMGQRTNCSELFNLRRTDEGYCWGFHSISMKIDPATEKDASSSLGEVAPRRVNGAGPNMGLTMLLDPEVDQYPSNSSVSDFKGFKVLLHDTTEFASMATQAFLVNPGRKVFVAVSAHETKSTENVRDTPKKERRCRYTSEENLQHYSKYNYANCFFECQIKTMTEVCGCVPYIYSQLVGVNLCNYDGTMCISNNSRKFSSVQPLDTGQWEGLDDSDSMSCARSCRNNCVEVKYIPEITSLTVSPRSRDDDIINSTLKDSYVFLRVFFKALTYVQYSQDVQYTVNDLVATFGGIVGLFIGFSFVSAAELVYFFTIRPVFRWFRRKPERAGTASSAVRPSYYAP